MPDNSRDHLSSAGACSREIDNFVEIFKLIRPPRLGMRLGNVEVYGDSAFLNRAAGGDHIIYLDFASRYDLDRRTREARESGRDQVANTLEKNRNRLGILVADVSGHHITDALAAAMLHQAFLTGVLYELDRDGEVTTRLFENLNTRFHNSLSFKKYIAFVYGEISSSGSFRFLSAASPPPLVFSSEFDRFVTICADRLTSFMPLGVAPSEDDVDLARHLSPLGAKPRYTVNEVNLLGDGDILLLYTDGLSELDRGDGELFVPDRLEAVVREAKAQSAEDIYRAVMAAVNGFAPPEDDLTLVVIKKTNGGA